MNRKFNLSCLYRVSSPIDQLLVALLHRGVVAVSNHQVAIKLRQPITVDKIISYALIWAGSDGGERTVSRRICRFTGLFSELTDF